MCIRDRPELTASRIHNISPGVQITLEKKETNTSHSNNSNSPEEKSGITENSQWNTSPLVPEVDEIPF